MDKHPSHHCSETWEKKKRWTTKEDEELRRSNC